ncbi:hypothetical protein lerEdw1_006461 [Lerista edwardsae]|nr:hypothetical protein lerEdw1_006461 [Lerista edwardsae]
MEWSGAWSDRSPEWQRVGQRERQRMGVTVQDDGEFWMSFEDFCAHFTDVVVCRCLNTARLSCRRRWVEGQRFGEWDPQKGRAGGCLNNRETFLDNPQFFFEVPGRQDSVLISLQQKDSRQLRGSGSGAHNVPVGFEVFSVSHSHGSGWPRTGAGACTGFPPRVAGSTYIDSRSVLLHVALPGGRYAVLPTTFAPGERGAFLLRVYSQRPARLRVIDRDEPPSPRCGCCLGAPQLIASIWVQRAVGLLLPHSGKPPGVFVKVRSEGEELRSRVHKGTSSPDFDFKAIFCRRRPHRPIRIEVWARRCLHNTQLGYVQVLTDTPTETGRTQVLPLEGAAPAGHTGSLLVETRVSDDLLAL